MGTGIIPENWPSVKCPSWGRFLPLADCLTGGPTGLILAVMKQMDPVLAMQKAADLRLEEILRLVDEGVSYTKIGRKFGITRQRISQIVKRAAKSPPPR